MKLLHGLATLMALAAEPSLATLGNAWVHLRAFSFHSNTCLTTSLVGGGGGLLTYVDGACDAGRWRMGTLEPFFGVRSSFPE